MGPQGAAPLAGVFPAAPPAFKPKNAGNPACRYNASKPGGNNPAAAAAAAAAGLDKLLKIQENIMSERGKRTGEFSKKKFIHTCVDQN